MNARVLPMIAAERDRLGLPRGVAPDSLMPVYLNRVTALIATTYYAIRGCGNYRPDPDKESPAPCLNCGRPASEHGVGR